jgi:hypothetical protein
MAKSILEIALSQRGVAEPVGDDKYIKWYGGFPLNVSWCAIFVSWVASQANIPTTVVPKFASCDAGMEWFQKKDLFEKAPAWGGAYVPRPEDVIFFSSNLDPKDSTHVGYVVKVDKTKVFTIEGNTSDMVAERSYLLTDKKILGYGTPMYPSTVVDAENAKYNVWLTKVRKALGATSTASLLKVTPTLKRGYSGGMVGLLQERLIMLGYSCGESGADNKFGPATEKAVMKYQKDVVGLKKQDGILDKGQITWKTLLEK